MGIISWLKSTVSKQEKNTSFATSTSNTTDELLTFDTNKSEYKTVGIPEHTNSSYRLSDNDEHTLQLIKVNFDSRYKPEDYRIDFESMPTQQDKIDGRIVLLWWLDKFDIYKKFPPSYFYFRYGIYVDAEIRYLNEIGWLSGFMLTEIGKNKLNDSQEIMVNHKFFSAENKENQDKHNKEINDLADHFYGDKNIDFSKIKLNDWSTSDDEYSEEQLREGYKLLEIAKVLTKKKEYVKSIEAVFEAWSLGYQSYDTWMRAAINARYLKDSNLEQEVLLMAIKWAKLSNVPTDNFEKRLNRVHELMANEFPDTSDN
ncbi:hypothetical protein EFL35_03045 [Weissella paramesenteroides]|uniref:hypothetical protein n=1 Tax=Weissella paramesenteroides TaxID=1249 RepID=UPI00223A8151|nr:hypothetical protein [Weissella paramesenteroides]MCS9983966.1 hypothetical protein [Weissella paramesenteroides]MCS9998978.1 hypothetical protein [Weissella paramesenteroides]MCT0259319.1 hypothetical protein [Weissella paramesenteroides]